MSGNFSDGSMRSIRATVNGWRDRLIGSPPSLSSSTTQANSKASMSGSRHDGNDCLLVLENQANLIADMLQRNEHYRRFIMERDMTTEFHQWLEEQYERSARPRHTSTDQHIRGRM